MTTKQSARASKTIPDFEDDVVIRPRQPKCKGTTNAGNPCGSFASKSSGYCANHDAAKQDEPRATVLFRRAFTRDNPLGVKAALAVAIEDTMSGRMSDRKLTAVSAAVRSWLAAHDRHVLEQEVEALRALAAEAQQVGSGERGYDTSDNAADDFGEG